MNIGLIPAFEEEENIGPAVTSLLAAGCSRVVVMDGAYAAPGPGLLSFLGGGCRSKDETIAEAVRAGAEVIVPEKQPRFGVKRELLLRRCGARPGDHVLFMDADERAVGRLPAWYRDGHACVILRNLKPNDLPDLRATWPRGDYGPEVPLLRYLAWSPDLHFVDIGKFAVRDEPIVVYRDEAPVLPVLHGFELHHVSPSSPARVGEKRRFYEPRIQEAEEARRP